MATGLNSRLASKFLARFRIEPKPESPSFFHHSSAFSGNRSPAWDCVRSSQTSRRESIADIEFAMDSASEATLIDRQTAWNRYRPAQPAMNAFLAGQSL